MIAPDLLGHGDSAKPRGDYSLGAHASILRDLLNALGYERATCIGQSLGGGIVLLWQTAVHTRMSDFERYVPQRVRKGR